MTIAFVVHTFRDLTQIARLVDRLARGSPQSFIVVNHSGPLEECEIIAKNTAAYRVLPVSGGRERFALLDGLISSLRWLERQNATYDWVVILSEQDYPIKPIRYLEQELSGSPFDGYFHHFDSMHAPDCQSEPMKWSIEEAINRYHFSYGFLKSELSPFERALLKLPRLILEQSKNTRLHTSHGLAWGRRLPSNPLPSDWRLFGGSYWMTIRRNAAKVLLDCCDERPDIVSYFRECLVPDEAFPQTVLANTKLLRLSRRELRWYTFDGARHGATKSLTATDLPELLSSGCYFARKISMRVNPDVLDALDEHLMNNPPLSD